MISYQTIYSNQIHLNSRDANVKMNGSNNSNVSFFLKDALKKNRTTIEMRVSLVNCQIPYSFYNINENNNQFNISGVVYNFPYGNYNVNTFISTWATVVGNNNWTITYNSMTNKLTFAYTNSFYFSDGGFSMFPVLGFATGITYYSTGTLTSAFPCNFSGLSRILISSPSFGINNINQNDEAFTKVLACIPINTSPSGIINYVNITNFKNIFKNHELSNIDILITDDNNNLINFNNQNWTLTLQLDFVNEVINDIKDLKDVYNNAVQEY